ncbi:tetratricopeptide repeat protein [Algimonas arctica]|uniref:tetratricopeptide repeat protein n=1 Tax=Algimonas arctica TaxID=1479486 RepID=UPI001677C0E4|nr:tetratricopeptide repeat protein [Algimonas arctica]
MLLSACAYAGGITPQEADVKQQVSVDQYMPASREMRDNIETQELFAQAAFWSHEYDLNPTDLEATLKLAASVRKLGNPGRAVEITQTSRTIHPRDPYLLAEHAAGLIADQRALDAVPVIDQGLRVTQGYGRLWSLKGAALDQLEEYEAARQNYNRALQITPNDPNVLTNLGLNYALSGDLRSAEMWLRRAAAMPGSGGSARENLAMVLQLQGRTEEAERELRLAGLSRGDRRLPAAPVPALTPRGTPAQMSSSGIPAQSVPTQGYQSKGYPDQGYVAQGTPSQGSYNAQMGGVPATRFSTTAPNGQTYTSSSQAARQSTQTSAQYGSAQSRPYTQSAAPRSQAYGNSQMTSDQQSVLNEIRQSLQPGAVTPQGQTRTQPQPYVVGPAIQTPQQQAQPYGTPAQPGYPQQVYPQTSEPSAEPQQGRQPARRRR